MLHIRSWVEKAAILMVVYPWFYLCYWYEKAALAIRGKRHDDTWRQRGVHIDLDHSGMSEDGIRLNVQAYHQRLIQELKKDLYG